jgi:glycosyltransferase involved in cell wall biosynthesis
VGNGAIKNQINKKAKLLGWQEKPEEYLQNYHFVFASGYLSILEAFANKKLVFSTYSNPLKEDYLKMTPFVRWIVIEYSPEKLAEKILHFLNHPDDGQLLIDNAYMWVQDQTWEKLTDTYLKLWKMSK